MASPHGPSPLPAAAGAPDHRQSANRSRDNSSPGSPPTTNQLVRPPRKKVDWSLPTPAVNDTPEDESVPKPLDFRVHSAEGGTKTPAEQEDQLRRDIHRIFSDQPPQQGSPPNLPQEPHPPQPSLPRINVPGEPSAPARPKKPVLRSGTATPQHPLSPSPHDDELLSGIDNLEGKNRSADVARAKADRLSKTLDEDETHSSSGFMSRWMHSSRHKRTQSVENAPLPLYHDGAESLASGQVTPDEADDLDYVPKPSKYRAMGLSAQMLLSGISPGASRRNSFNDSGNSTPGSASPPMTPQPGTHSLRGSPRQSFSSMSKWLHVPSGSGESRPTSSDGPRAEGKASDAPKRPSFGRFNSADHIDNRPSSSLSHSARHGSTTSLIDNFSKFANIKSVQKTPSQRQRRKKQMDISIKKHVQETRTRQLYLLKLCKALMEYGAPSHRLEDYMKMSARVLETEAQFLYMPGCMIVSFDDSATHTTEVKLVRSVQGVDLGKLKDVHSVYKDVVHDNIGVLEATETLTEIMTKQKKFRVWFLVLMHGFASATVGPFAFQARWIDIPLAFALGVMVGFLRLVWAAKSDLYSAIFEVTSVILTSFLSRAFGSIYRADGSPIFCFSALAQSSIALILPGYIILCGALELQSHNILAGSVRVFYAIIYSLFIGFGLTIGTVVYGAIDGHATSSASCQKPLDSGWNFFFVFLYSITLMIINQAKVQQMPVMLAISLVGYVVSYFSGNFFKGQPSVSSGLAAVAVSVCANGYSRIGGWMQPIATKLYNRYAPWWRKHGFAISVHVDRPNDADEEKQAASTRPWWRTPIQITRPKAPAEEEPKAENTASDQEERTERQDSVASTITLGGFSEDPDEIGPKDQVPPSPETKVAKKRKKVNYALAAAAMLPAIFVLVPSGLSVSGSLLQGIQTADSITNYHNSTSPSNGSSTGMPTSPSPALQSVGSAASGNAFSVSASVIEIAIGLTVGLFLGALIVYPYGKGGRGSKSRSGLFTF